VFPGATGPNNHSNSSYGPPGDSTKDKPLTPSLWGRTLSPACVISAAKSVSCRDGVMGEGLFARLLGDWALWEE